MMSNFTIRVKKWSILLCSFTVAVASAAPATAVKPTSPPPADLTMTGVGPVASAVGAPTLTIPPPRIDAKAYVLLDASTGAVLASDNPDAHRAPASLTKMMTLYVISKSLKAGQIHLNDPVPISKDAWRTGGSRMFVQIGTQVPVEELVKGIAIVSGNDAAVAMAEYVGGSTDNFVSLMNQTAAQLGMNNTHFVDVNGLPAADHYSSSRDLAILADHLINDFPDYYKSWYGQQWFEFNNIRQPNRNRLLWLDSSVDGIKTGFTDDAGYCLVASAKRNDTRLVAVIMGSSSPKTRTQAAQSLLNWGFHTFSTHQLYAAGQEVASPGVAFGKYPVTPMGVADRLAITLPTGQYKKLKANLTLNPDIKAPIKKGMRYGQVAVTLNDQVLFTAPVIALQDNPRGNIWQTTKEHISRWFSKEG